MKPTVKETVLFGILGALMYASKLAMEVLPNIHILGVLVIAFTITFRKKALYPIYVFVLLLGLFNGFNTWWIPHLYLWTVLWALTMILPKKLPKKVAPFVYMAVCAMHGFLYGTLYAPAQAIMFGLDFKGMIAWIISGLPFDIVHGISNFFCGALIVPIVKILQKSSKA
jgi:energy-coupling factor transport system substrate-specific component